jgi:glycine/D-amino acid oxidase-like deaminating enzyme
LLHPLSPRGKLVHWGLEGLAATNRLVESAAAAEKESSVLRHEIYRIAVTPQQAHELQRTALALPELCTWMTPAELFQLHPDMVGSSSSATAVVILGGVCITGGAKVIHVPSYLQGLYKACEKTAEQRANSTVSWSMIGTDMNTTAWRKLVDRYDTVVYAGGSGLFSKGLLTLIDDGVGGDSASKKMTFPVQLVRGQSLELKWTKNTDRRPLPAILGGKYISPLPDPGLVLVGATHEFQEQPMTQDAVFEELKQRTYDMAPFVWKNDTTTVHRVTSGTRVQSERGPYGRLPIVGRLPLHDNAWIFTGLSSRGLLYHGLLGDILTDAILEGHDEAMFGRHEGLNWWKTKVAATSCISKTSKGLD